MNKNIWLAVGGLVALLLAVGVGFGLGKQAAPNGLGSQLVEVVVKDFRNGFKIGGSTFSDGSRNLSNIGTISSGVITSTGLIDSGTATVAGTAGNKFGGITASSVAVLSVGNTVTSTVVFGSSNAPVCIAAPALTAAGGNVAATVVWYVFTTTTIQPLATKPSWCP